MKRELTKRLFTACILVFLLTMVMSMLVAGSYLRQRNRAEVKEKAQHVSALIDAQGMDVLPLTEPDSTMRTTVIAPDGKVLFDSEFSADVLENHADREEIRDAFRTGTGESERYSKSLLQKTERR